MVFQVFAEVLPKAFNPVTDRHRLMKKRIFAQFFTLKDFVSLAK